MGMTRNDDGRPDGVASMTKVSGHPSGPDAYKRTYEAIASNHGTAHALLDTLRACDVAAADARPYREVEEELSALPSVAESTQGPHTLLGILVRTGGIATIEVPEAAEGACGSPLSKAGEADEASSEPTTVVTGEVAAEGGTTSAQLQDQPVDVLVRTTEEGREVLAAFDPVGRFETLLAGEPAGYADAYALVLATCDSDEGGASRRDVECALAGNPALTDPKRVYPSYFISRLESIEGLVWDGAWHTTDAGERMLGVLATSL
jgi:hypothetical protein